MSLPVLPEIVETHLSLQVVPPVPVLCPDREVNRRWKSDSGENRGDPFCRFYRRPDGLGLEPWSSTVKDSGETIEDSDSEVFCPGDDEGRSKDQCIVDNSQVVSCLSHPLLAGRGFLLVQLLLSYKDSIV